MDTAEPTTAAQQASEAAASAIFSPPVTLDTPIKRGDQKIAKLVLRKPQSGELRGLTLVDTAQLDVNTLIKLLPRITQPAITSAEAAALEPADMLALGTEVSAFLLQRANRPVG